ncbi:TlpA disulfide reductase family protein [Labilibaculum sp. K2S]|uniref:TlpA disulfide reductase family protein n=1 Tax=Labilibaculum sp. K2S TaxID=3056386 RepID=UPI0025A40E6E|nr:TlpA disulfide reductase family protein [Labilibaculum sp. K2S]MDM8158445.1 TlpA disulfide reductase family protein [Labilibaculum sp. K2S]
MKKSISGIVVFVFIVMITACSQKNADYTFSGEISGLKEGTKVELVPGATHKKEEPVASAIVTNGKFEFSGKLEEPRLFYLQVVDHVGVLRIMLENSEISLKAKAVFEENDNGAFVNFSDVQVNGSNANDLYKEKLALKDKFEAQHKKYYKDHEAILAAVRNAQNNKNKVLVDSLQKLDSYQAFALAEKGFFDGIEKTTNEAILTSKDSWWGPLVMLESMSYFTDEQIPLYEQFSDEAKNSYYGKLVKKELYPERVVGKQAPEFTLADREGKAFNSSELMEGKKYILIDFWASWCGPCRREIPNLKHMYELYASKGLQIISISKDEDRAAWLKALDKEKMAWPNLLNEKGVDDLYFVKTIPAIFLVDASTGKVMDDKLRGEALDQKLEELLK